MRRVRLLDLGSAPAIRSQTVYHAAARAMGPDTPDTIIIVSPAQPYVCIGFHQDVEQEVDLAYCEAHALPVVRREVGGGAVYLDQGQVFSQWVFHPDHLPAELERQFELYIRCLVRTYRALGIGADLRPVNDVHVAGKKIGGTGAAQIGLARVLVGSLMFDFDKATMARVLKVSDEKMRDKVFDSLNEYMTTMREQLDKVPPREAVISLYLEECARALGAEIVSGSWTADEEALAARLDAEFATREWLYQKGRRHGTGVKIHEDVQVVAGAFKAPGGLVRVTATLNRGTVADIAFSGDFTLIPTAARESLEEAVRGVPVDRERLTARLDAVYRELGVGSPGLGPSHFAEAIVRAADPVNARSQ